MREYIGKGYGAFFAVCFILARQFLKTEGEEEKNGKKFQEGGEENGWVKEGMRWQGELWGGGEEGVEGETIRWSLLDRIRGQSCMSQSACLIVCLFVSVTLSRSLLKVYFQRFCSM